MDNLPVKYLPQAGQQVRRKGREAIGVVVSVAYWSDFPIQVRYSDTRLSFYPRHHDLEVV